MAWYALTRFVGTGRREYLMGDEIPDGGLTPIDLAELREQDAIREDLSPQQVAFLRWCQKCPSYGWQAREVLAGVRVEIRPHSVARGGMSPEQKADATEGQRLADACLGGGNG